MPLPKLKRIRDRLKTGPDFLYIRVKGKRISPLPSKIANQPHRDYRSYLSYMTYLTFHPPRHCSRPAVKCFPPAVRVPRSKKQTNRAQASFPRRTIVRPPAKRPLFVLENRIIPHAVRIPRSKKQTERKRAYRGARMCASSEA